MQKGVYNMDNEEDLSFLSTDEDYENPEDILDEMEDLISSSRQILLSNRATIDPDQFLELIDRLRDTLPESLVQAREIVADSEQILNEAENQANAIIENAKKKAQELTSAAVPYNVIEEAKKLLEKAICLAEEETE